MDPLPLRVALNIQKSVTELDSAKISLATQYNLINNLYGRLIRYDDDGQLMADIPISFSWNESEIIFVFGDKVKTLSGHVISAEDAEISLKRLILKGKSGHGDLRRFLCPGFTLETLKESCPGIHSSENVLTLKVTKPEFLPLLVGILESADYSIVPKMSINMDTGELIDRNHRETSGVYYVARDSSDGHLLLRANSGHYLYGKNIPETVEIIPVDSDGASKGFLEGKIDLIPTTQYWGNADGRKILANDKNEIHETLPFRLLLVVFSPVALRDFTPEQRMYAGMKAGLAFSKIFGQVGGRPTEQFFQVLSDGTLNSEELEEIKDFRNRSVPPKFPRPITYGGVSKHFSAISEALKDAPEIKVMNVEQHPLDVPPASRPDMYIITTDSAWTENLSLIGYNLEVGTFSLPGLNADEWFQSYISVKEKIKRIELLRSLHFQLLKNVSLIPIEVAPYYAVARPGLKIEHSRIAAGTNLWSIRRN